MTLWQVKMTDDEGWFAIHTTKKAALANQAHWAENGIESKIVRWPDQFYYGA